MCGARTKRAKRIAATMPIVAELLGHGRECDDVMWTQRRHRGGDDALWLTTPISMNGRGDEPLAESNYATAERLIGGASAYGTDTRYDAWPGGMIHTLTVRADDALALRELDKIVNALADYSALDDDDVSAREWEQNHPNERECYGDDECGCEYRTHMHVTSGYEWCDVCQDDVSEWEEARYSAIDPRVDVPPAGQSPIPGL